MLHPYLGRLPRNLGFYQLVLFTLKETSSKVRQLFFFPFKDSRNKSPEELSYNVPGIQVFSWVSGNHDAQHGSRLAVIPEYLRLQLGSYDMGTLGKHYLNDVR